MFRLTNTLARNQRLQKRGRPYFHRPTLRPPYRGSSRSFMSLSIMDTMANHPVVTAGVICVGAWFLGSSINIVEPNERGLVTKFGKYTHTAEPGLNIIWPFPIGNLETINMATQKVSVDDQLIITKEQLNATVSAIVYYKVSDPYKAAYNVDDYQHTIPVLAQTTLRAVLGTFSLMEANSQRNEINDKLRLELSKQIEQWGLDVVSVEVQEFEPTQDVQDSMNRISMAKQHMLASENEADAQVVLADGDRRATVKRAEAEAQARRLKAEAEADALRIESAGLADAIRMKAEAEATALQLVYESAQKNMVGPARRYQEYKTMEESLRNNSKFVLTGNQGDSGVLKVLDLHRVMERKDDGFKV